MTQFRKKPVVIEAAQWFAHGDHPKVIRAWSTPEGSTTRAEDADAFGPDFADEFPAIETLEGLMCVTPGDWIITGVKGEHYPCKPDIFAMTYEALATPAAADGEPVAEVIRDGATVRLQWAGVKAAHNAKPGPLFAAAPSAVAPQWQPIKTAPKDGTAFFACLEASDIPHAMRFDGDDLKLTWDGHLVSAHDWPTHWMPLPAPPTEAVASPSECDSLTGQEGEGA